MISIKERQYLRDLARRLVEMAGSAENQLRKKRWYDHNDLKNGAPMIVVEYDSFYDDIRPVLTCESAFARQMEEQLKCQLSLPELIGDDRVIPDFYSIFLPVESKQNGFDIPIRKAEDGNSLAYQPVHPFTQLEGNLHKLQPSQFFCDIAAARAQADRVEDIIGDILPVRIRNNSLMWSLILTNRIVSLMSMETYFLSMYDEPDALHDLMTFLRDDALRWMAWQEQNGLLTPNWGNEHGGSNSFGYTRQLPGKPVLQPDLRKAGTDVCLSDIWININAQEAVGISKECFKSFVLPYYQSLCEQAGLVYYGCCEPVHDLIEDCLDRIPNLRKLSISAWCDEVKAAERMRGKNIIYSRKPSPNYLGVGYELDEEAYTRHIKATLLAAKGLNLEFIFRDIYTLKGNIPKLKRAVDIIRACAAV